MGTTKKTAIVCGGEINNLEWLNNCLKSYDVIIAADSGYDYLEKLNILPNVIIGDFDSLISTVPKSVRIISYPAHKDETDFLLCLRYCKESNYSTVDVFGAWGGRADHSMAAVFALNEAMEFGQKATFITEQFKMFVINESCEIENTGSYISIFSLTDGSEISLIGYEYPLDHCKLKPCTSLGVSNKIKEKTGKIIVFSGKFLIIIQN